MALPPKILIVDDDHDTHALIADLMAMSGYEATCVHSTNEARAIIRLAPPVFFVLDLHIDQPYAGWTLLQELRADPATATIPAVLVTSDRGFVTEHRAEVHAAGAMLLDKPFDVDVLIKLVEGALGPVQA